MALSTWKACSVKGYAGFNVFLKCVGISIIVYYEFRNAASGLMTDSPQELVNKGRIAEMVAGLENISLRT